MEAAKLGLNATLIKKLGRWESKCYGIYECIKEGGRSGAVLGCNFQEIPNVICKCALCANTAICYCLASVWLIRSDTKDTKVTGALQNYAPCFLWVPHR